MTKLLYVQASPRRAGSKSITVADAYVQALRENNPNLEVDTFELWHIDLPQFDGDKVAAKMNVLTGQDQNEAERTAWHEIEEIANRFASADRYLFAVPMWNGGIPYRLKQYIDVIHQPGILWSLDPEAGYIGLLKDKHATVVLTAGAWSPQLPSPAFGIDHQSTYLRAWLEQAGVTDIDEIRFQPTLLTADAAGDQEKAVAAARALAQSHGQI